MADPPLSPRGRRQAESAGRLLAGAGFTAVVSSDLRRARATAAGMAPGLGVTAPIAVEPGLREYDLGEWSGLTRVEIEARWPGAIEDWRQGRLVATPGGEQRRDFVTRVCAAVAAVAAQQAGQKVLVVTHGGVISALFRELGGPARRFSHLSGIWIEAGPDGLTAGAEVSLLDAEVAATDTGEGTSLTPIMDTPAR